MDIKIVFSIIDGRIDFRFAVYGSNGQNAKENAEILIKKLLEMSLLGSLGYTFTVTNSLASTMENCYVIDGRIDIRFVVPGLENSTSENAENLVKKLFETTLLGSLSYNFTITKSMPAFT